MTLGSLLIAAVAIAFGSKLFCDTHELSRTISESIVAVVGVPHAGFVHEKRHGAG